MEITMLPLVGAIAPLSNAVTEGGFSVNRIYISKYNIIKLLYLYFFIEENNLNESMFCALNTNDYSEQ